MPFENTLDILKLQGDVIIDIFEHSVSSSFDEIEFIGIHMLQISGFQLTFNTSKPVGRRLETIQIKNKYNEFENINLYKSYAVIAPSFLARGGDGYTMIKTNRKHYKVGLLDIDLIEKYILNKSPISPELDHRIIMLK
ncbi:CLUMA_CG020263, isoform A [Clunio marinus]|uniref:CLUMA_CG020263, isoform A n=1 Tax=Clunio marinus TaxID=568069 RepID=A0A1J1J687_9DIPT|nr:CLUMA_CG020263, isoform A [Clunio marinus]